MFTAVDDDISKASYVKVQRCGKVSSHRSIAVYRFPVKHDFPLSLMSFGIGIILLLRLLGSPLQKNSHDASKQRSAGDIMQ